MQTSIVRERSELISVWKWCGYNWNLLIAKTTIQAAWINLDKGNNALPQLAFPVGCNPNELSDGLYASAPLQESKPREQLDNPQPAVKPTTRLEAYQDREQDITIVYSYSPKLIAPHRYKVKNFGGHFACTCPAGQHGLKCKHVKYVASLLSDEITLTREPVEVFFKEFFPGVHGIERRYIAAYGKKNIGSIVAKNDDEAVKIANTKADNYYREARMSHYLRGFWSSAKPEYFQFKAQVEREIGNAPNNVTFAKFGYRKVSASA